MRTGGRGTKGGGGSKCKESQNTQGEMGGGERGKGTKTAMATNTPMAAGFSTTHAKKVEPPKTHLVDRGVIEE